MYFKWPRPIHNIILYHMYVSFQYRIGHMIAYNVVVSSTLYKFNYAHTCTLPHKYTYACTYIGTNIRTWLQEHTYTRNLERLPCRHICRKILTLFQSSFFSSHFCEQLGNKSGHNTNFALHSIFVVLMFFLVCYFSFYIFIYFICILVHFDPFHHPDVCALSAAYSAHT